jgi:hypothetical protein
MFIYMIFISLASNLEGARNGVLYFWVLRLNNRERRSKTCGLHRAVSFICALKGKVGQQGQQGHTVIEPSRYEGCKKAKGSDFTY